MEIEELLKQENLIIMTSHEYPIDPMKIAFWGGMGVVTKEISERLVKKGFHVLVTPRKIKEYASSKPFFQEYNGVHVLSLPIERFQAGSENADLYNYFPIIDGTIALDHSYTTWRYLQKIGMKNPIIHGHDWLSAGFMREAKREGYRSIFTVHMSALRDSGIKGMRLADKRLELERIAGNYANKIHYVSLSQMKSCKVYHWNHDKEHHVIPNGVDILKYIPSQEIPTEDYILFIGRLSPVKNVPQLVLGWSEFNKDFPQVGLKILGASGVSNFDVERMINSLSASQRSQIENRIEMVSEEEKIHYIQNSSVCCFPSSTEAFGIVSIEAQACGKPVVVGNVGGFKENVLEGITGIHVNGRSSSSIAEGLRLAYSNRKAWGKNARNLVTAFYDWDKLVEDFIEELYT